MVLAAAALTLGVLAVVLHVRVGHPALNIMLTGLTGLLFILAGLLGSYLHQQNRSGVLMLWVALSLFAEDVQLSEASLTFTLGLVLANVSTPMLCHLALAFPRGWLPSAPSRALVLVAWLSTVGLNAAQLPFREVKSYRPGGLNLLFWGERPGTVAALVAVQDVAGLVVLAVVFGVLVRRLRQATAALRRVVLPAYTVGLACAACGGAVAVADLAGSSTAYRTGVTAFSVCFLLLPLGYLVGVLRIRLSRARVGTLMLGLSEGSTLPDLQAGLRIALEDPTLELLPGTPASAAVAGPGRIITPITHEGSELGLLMHDPAVREDEYALRAVAAAAGLVLHNLRLAEEAFTHLSEVRAAAGRLVVASDQARRQVERDLHDGAQQQLLSVALRLRLLEHALSEQSAAATAAQIAAAAESLEAALADLRALARGVYPPILSEAGLLTALPTLADRCPVPVSIAVEPLPPLPAGHQATLYYATAEALTNIARHARATAASVHVDHHDGVVRLTVTDDGCGGARIDGSGLSGIRDRARAFGGDLRLVNRDGGGGTTLTLTVAPP